MLEIVVLAAGKSQRLKSKTLKPMQVVIDKPLIGYLLETLNNLNADKIHVVVNNDSDDLKKYVGNDVNYVLQQEQLGTGHAVMSTLPYLEKTGYTIILMADAPLIKTETLKRLIERGKNYDFTLVSTIMSDPSWYGRVVRDNQRQIKGIVEHYNATSDQLSIKEINTGVYIVKNEILHTFMPYIAKNDFKNEYKFTDVVELLIKNKKLVNAIIENDTNQFFGVNNQKELNALTNLVKDEILHKHFENGVKIIDSNSVLIGSDVVIESDVVIYPNNYILGNSVVSQGTVVYPNNWINNSKIGECSQISFSHVEDSIIGDNNNIGPFARIRGNCEFGKDVKIGNFVEVKNSHISDKSASKHLSYIGDSVVGKGVNVGCGVITVNYDGVKKHKTIIEDGAFVGCNSNLIAPITIGKDSFIAAGSTITKNLGESDFAIERSEEVHKTGYATKYKKPKN